MVTSQYAIVGMTCEMCDRHVAEAFASIGGVSSASADFRTGEALVVSEKELSDGDVAAALEEAGYALD